MVLHSHWAHRSRMLGGLHSGTCNRALEPFSEPASKLDLLSLKHTRSGRRSSFMRREHVWEVWSEGPDWILCIEPPPLLFLFFDFIFRTAFEISLAVYPLSLSRTTLRFSSEHSPPSMHSGSLVFVFKGLLFSFKYLKALIFFSTREKTGL